MIDGPVCPEIIFVQLVRKQPWRPCRVPITTACVNSVKHRSITTRMTATRATATSIATVTSHDTNCLQGSKASVQYIMTMPAFIMPFYAALPPRAFRPRGVCTYVWTWYTRGTWCKRGIRGRGYTPAANDEGIGEKKRKLYSRWSLLLQARLGLGRRCATGTSPSPRSGKKANPSEETEERVASAACSKSATN
ncbi:hypothetical protein ALC62_06015 [Cyphomyrmex costatus]|uniref:Uncharacterized protein n=1 Tax=Cyphomyrmex costatus TaxID=456900 RepID=A0A195CQY4_9HYME|nr:hypothetical protein ALC62_06015 [Cyphomyrmex costatus]